MTKSPDAFRTISEVAEWLDTPAHVLRFWESKFSQVKPVKRAGGRRYYRPEDMALLGGIKSLLHEQGMTIKGAQKIMRERGAKWVCSLAPTLPGEADADFVEAPAEESRGAPSNVVPLTAPDPAWGDEATGDAPQTPDAATAEEDVGTAGIEAGSSAPAAPEPAQEETASADLDAPPASGAILEGSDTDAAPAPSEPATAEGDEAAPSDSEAGMEEAASRDADQPPEDAQHPAGAAVHESPGDDLTAPTTAPAEAPETAAPEQPTSTEEAEPLPTAAVLEGPVPGADAPELPLGTEEAEPPAAADPAGTERAEPPEPLDAEPPLPEPEQGDTAEPGAANEDETDGLAAMAEAEAADAPDDDVWADLAPTAGQSADPAGLAGSGALLADLAALPRGALVARAGRIAPLVARLEALAAEMARR